MILNSDRIRELLAPFVAHGSLTQSQLESLQTYLDLLLKWNSRINLTAVRNPEQIVARHFGESLFAARHLFSQPDPVSVIDIGSGAGFPGIPIKIWNPSIELTLVESSGKKSAFLREAARTLNLKQVVVESRRAEGLSTRAEVVTLRAVERFDLILPTARNLVRPGGRLALLIGQTQVEAAKSILPDLKWPDPNRIPLSSNRVLLVGSS